MSLKLIALGSPGVGKGTYTQDLVNILHLAHVSSGDLFREELKRKTPLGKQIQQFMDKGQLVPDELTIALVRQRLEREDCQKGFILDGFPRTVPQAEALDKITLIDLVLNFTADHAVILGRLSGRMICRQCGRIYHKISIIPKTEGVCDICAGELYQRDDDWAEVVEKRLQQYVEQAAPLIAYYRKKGLLQEIHINEEYGKHKEMIQGKILKVIREK